MHPILLRTLLMRGRQQAVAQAAHIYNLDLDRAQIEEAQLRRFNKIWEYCLREIPFYKSWSKEHDLPSQIGHIRELGAFPFLTKDIIIAREDEIFQQGALTDAYMTGGTTGIGIRYPRGPLDYIDNYTQTYAGRSWWGARPFDAYLHVWGHSHLYGGDDLNGKIRKIKRRVADAMVNAVRVNAYDMTTEGLEGHHQTLLRQNPTYLIGYTNAVFKLARHIEAQGGLGARLTHLRAAMVTSETVTQADVDLISRVFGVPVVSEYGAAETGTMAMSRGGTWPLQVLWQGYAIRLTEASGDISVTTLSNRLFPLVNYALGDIGKPGDVVDGNALSLAYIVGRDKDEIYVSSTSGQQMELSAIMPIHILKAQPGIIAVQFRQETPHQLRIFLTGYGQLPLQQLEAIFTKHMHSDHPEYDPASVSFEQIEKPLLNKKGSQALFV